MRIGRSVVGAALFSSLAIIAGCRSSSVAVTHPTIRSTDGIGLAADLILPSGVPATGVPTVLIQTRYWRSFRLIGGGGGGRIPQGPRDGIVARLHAAGYAVVVTDVRGTGASEGEWPWPWSAGEVGDMGAIIDWIVAQPWSNGAVGATGVSYEGTTALLAAAAGRPALKAVLARQIEWELVDETLAPGGVRNIAFVDVWSRAVHDLDHGTYPEMFPSFARWVTRGVQRRDDDRDGVALRALQAARPASSVAQRAAAVRQAHDRFGPDGPPTDSLGPAGHVSALATTSAVVGIWGSWWDGATADAVFRATRAMPILEARIGPWDHEGTANASPLRRGASETPTVSLDSVVAFFSRHLSPSAANGEPRGRPAPTYAWFVAGTERWQRATAWPTTQERAWTVAGNRLNDNMSEGDTSLRIGDAMMPLVVNYDATTGRLNRWTSGLARPVDAPDRARAVGLRSWTSATLATPLRVFGAGRFTCRLVADAPDAALHVYVESIDPGGHVRLLTEGTQRLQHAVESLDVEVRVRPVAFELPAGWALRFSIAGADASTFERVPASGGQRLVLDGRQCQLVLPVLSPA